MLGDEFDSVVRVAEIAEQNPGDVVLGRDIRTDPGAIAGYCFSSRKPIFEDLTTLVEGMAYADRVVPRRLHKCWKRSLKVVLPVFELGVFQKPAVIDILLRSAEFLTGDEWCFEFLKRTRPFIHQQDCLPLTAEKIQHVVPFSDGLDSFAQAKLSSYEFGSRHIMLVRAGLSTKGFLPHLLKIRVPRKFGGAKLRETTYRTRPIVFFTMAAITAVITGAETVAIGESGQGSIGPSCVPLLGEWPFRSTHPAFIELWRRFINYVLESDVCFQQPQVWKTKGTVLNELRCKGIEEGWEQTRSCSGRPAQRLGRDGCGFCGGCLLRSVSTHAAGMGSLDKDRAFDVFASNDMSHDRFGNERPMEVHEREVAILAIGDMHKFARLSSLPNFQSILACESTLINPERPKVAQEKIISLQRQHEKE